MPLAPSRCYSHAAPHPLLPPPGFLTLQRAIDTAILRHHAAPGADAQVVGRGMELSPDNTSRSSLSTRFFRGLFVNFVAAFVLGVIMADVLYEKENGIVEGMSLMGLRRTAYWAHWLGSYAVLHLPSAALFTGAFYLINYTSSLTSPLWLFLFLYLYHLAITAFAFFLTVPLAKAETATTLSFLLFFLLSLAYMPALLFDTPPALRAALSLLPTCGMINGVNTILVLEGARRGLTSASLAQGGTVVPFTSVLTYTAASIPLWVILTLYCSRVVPDSHGVSQPFYYPLHDLLRAILPARAGQRRRRSRADGDPLVGGGEGGSASASSAELVGSRRKAPHGAGAAATPAGGNHEAVAAHDEEAALQVQGLHKTFHSGCMHRNKDEEGNRIGDVHAVNDLSLDFYKGEIFALLGHNGAGKTTAIGCITGVVPPSAGTVLYDGLDLHSHTDAVRTRLGVCTQHDLVYPQLTGVEHLRLFGGLRGIPSGAELDEEVARKLDLMDLGDDAAQPVAGYSGGMRRKVAVGVALLGDPAFLYLDEPTAGLDPASRRQIWRMIQAGKEQRVTLFSTHFMDEADLLSDRIGILKRGRLFCSGTSLFLKHRFGVGYTLTLTAAPGGADSRAVDSLLRSALPTATPLSHSGQELSYRLPLAAVPAFPAFFRRLDSSLPSLRVRDYGLSITTLEEVFLRTANEKGEDLPGEEEEQGEEEKGEGGDPEAQRGGDGMANPLNARVGGSRRASDAGAAGAAATERSPPSAMRLLGVMMRAGWLTRVRQRESFIFGTLFPLTYVIIAFYLGSVINSGDTTPDALPLSYGGLVPFPSFFSSVGAHSAATHGLAEATRAALATGPGDAQSAAHPPALRNFSSLPALDQVTLELTEEEQPAGTPLAFTGLAFDGASGGGVGNLTAVHNTSMPAALPVLLNALHNALLGSGEVGGGAPSITVASHPLPFPSGVDIASLLLPMFVGMAFLGGSLSGGITTVGERENRIAHQLQLMGLPARLYWTGHLLFNSLLIVPLIVFTTAMIYVFGITNLQGVRLWGWLAVAATFPVAVIPFVFVICWSFRTVKAATQLFPTALNAISIMPFVAVFVLQQQNTDSAANTAKWLGDALCVIPTYSMFRGLGKLLHLGSKTGGDPTMADVFGFGDGIAIVITLNIANGIFYTLLLSWLEVRRHRPDQFSSSPALRRLREMDGATPPADAEGRPGRGSRSDSALGLDTATLDDDVDEDVEKEQAAAQEMAGWSRDRLTGSILLRSLYKLFPRSKAAPGAKVAVRDLTLVVRPGVSSRLSTPFPLPLAHLLTLPLFVPALQDFFCLLGHNGAGKSTALNVLTGALAPTHVEAARLSGFDLRAELPHVYTVTGYCPQFDATWGTLSVKEHLELYAAIKGVPPASVSGVVRASMQALEIEEYGSVRSDKLSGGNRRKLSVAVALLGDPDVSFLDEPSTVRPCARGGGGRGARSSPLSTPSSPCPLPQGMDPGARRKLWDALQQHRSNKCHVLTTHSMEEADALATRIGIMTDGQLRALGSPQQLKSKYGRGFMLEICVDEVRAARAPGAAQHRGAARLTLAPAAAARRARWRCWWTRSSTPSLAPWSRRE